MTHLGKGNDAVSRFVSIPFFFLLFLKVTVGEKRSRRYCMMKLMLCKQFPALVDTVRREVIASKKKVTLRDILIEEMVAYYPME